MDQILKLFGGSEQLWQYIQKYAQIAGLESTRVVLELYYVLKSPNTPVLDKTIIVAALAYQLLPEDLVSTEKFGLLGILDNGAALALAYNRVKTRVTPQIEIQVNAILNQWFGDGQSVSSRADSRNMKKESFEKEWDSQTIQVSNDRKISQARQTSGRESTSLWTDDDIVID